MHPEYIAITNNRYAIDVRKPTDIENIGQEEGRQISWQIKYSKTTRFQL